MRRRRLGRAGVGGGRFGERSVALFFTGHKQAPVKLSTYFTRVRLYFFISAAGPLGSMSLFKDILKTEFCL